MRARLQKLLAGAGLASRREAEGWIRAGRVTVNGKVAGLGDSADPAQDRVEVDGRRLRAEAHAYWLLHKPRGVLSTRSDSRRRRTVLELLPAAARERRLFPVGRLDLDSEGLLLLTNDGEVTQALLHPSLETERSYQVEVRGRLLPDAARKLARGVYLADGPTLPAQVGPRRYEPRGDTTRFELVVREGRKRQIRRACARLGHPVLRLVRVRMGPLRLGRLKPGEVRPLRAEELRALLAHVRERHAASPRARARAHGSARAATARSRPRARGGSRSKARKP